ncbi:MAG: gliding motility-associated C-terminal domain-containing protein [Bacteroidota bacterium]
MIFLIHATKAQKIYVAGNGSQIIFRSDLDGTTLEPMGAGGFAGSIRDLVVDPVTNRAFWIDISQSAIRVADITSTSGVVTFENTANFLLLNTSSNAFALEIDLLNRKLYWTAPGDGEIVRTDIDVSTPVADPIITGEFQCQGLGLDPENGKLYYVRDITSSEIRIANLDGSSNNMLIDSSSLGFADFTEVTVDDVNDRIYFTYFLTGIGQIWTADLGGSAASRQMIIDNLENPRGIDVDGDGGFVYYADAGVSGNIGKAELDGSNKVNIITGLDAPLNVALDLSTFNPPKVYWTEGLVTPSEGEIHRINLDGTEFERYYTGFADRTSGISIDTDNGVIYWTDGNQAEVKRGTIGETDFEDSETIIDFNPSSVDSLEQVVYERTQQMIYYTYWGQDQIQMADPNDPDPMSTVSTIISTPNPVGIAVDEANSKIYYTSNNINSSGNIASLWRADFDGGNQEELFSQSFANPEELYYDLKIDPLNERVYWSAGPKDDLGRILSNDVNETPPFSSPLSFNINGEPRGIDLDLINNKIYWVCRGAPSLSPTQIMRSNLDGSSAEVIHLINNIIVPNPGFIALDLRGLTAPCSNPPTVDAGVDQTICSDEIVSLGAGFGGSATSIFWSTLGDGSFNDNSSLTAIYTPGANDLINQIVTLRITTDDPDGSGPCVIAEDEIDISFEQSITIDAGTDQDVCETDNVSLNATLTGTFSNFQWSSNGDGTFDDPVSLNPNYIPGQNDVGGSQITITLTANPLSVCPVATDDIGVNIFGSVVARDYTQQTFGGMPINFNVIVDNESQITGPLSVTIISQPANGTASLDNGVITYTAIPGNLGTDQIEYEITGQCGTDIGTISIDVVNQAPIVNAESNTTQTGSLVTIDLCQLISDVDNDFNDLTITVLSITSNASTSIEACNLVIDYGSSTFLGQDDVVIEACDLSNACTQNTLVIVVEPLPLNIYNAVSANNDGVNDWWIIEGLTTPNVIKIYNRWGDEVEELNNYEGLADVPNNALDDLIVGTYFYKIESPEGSFEGYLTIKK